MFSSGDLALWLRGGDLEANVGALVDLVTSGDIRIVTVLDEFTVERGHTEFNDSIWPARRDADDGADLGIDDGARPLCAITSPCSVSKKGNAARLAPDGEVPNKR